MKKTLASCMILIASHQTAEGCSRLVYETGTKTYITARSMDWNDPTAAVSLWSFPRGMDRNGAGPDPLRWTSKYGSVVASFYDVATADGMNERGLAGNALYLAESDYGDHTTSGKPTLSVGLWLQYVFDNYATVAEAVDALKESPFSIHAPVLPNGRAATVHLSISDPTGDSAILEYLDGGKLSIHHSPDYRIMTNSPIYDQQLALNTYWELIGGSKMLPGTISAADRFVRLSYNLKSSPKYEDPFMAVASAFSQIRGISVPLGMADPDHPNISATLWRTVADHDAKRFYFDSATIPAVFWVDVDKLDLEAGSSPKELKIVAGAELGGEVSGSFKDQDPFVCIQ